MYKYLLIFLMVCTLVIPKQAWAQNAVQPSATEELTEKNPWFAALFSAVLPGTGQMYVDEELWPNILITGGVILAIGAYFFVDQQRSASIRGRDINGDDIISGNENLPDAHWEALTLILQIGVPSIWLWNLGDAYRQADEHNKKVIYNLNPKQNGYIMKERLLRFTLWRF